MVVLRIAKVSNTGIDSSFFFIFKLGGMDPDHHQFAGIFFFQFRQVRQGVDAVDATECPKIEEDDFPPQGLEGDRFGRV